MDFRPPIRTDYPFDDDPPPRWLRSAGDLAHAPWRTTTAAARLRAAPGVDRLRDDGRATPFQVRKQRRDLVILLLSEVGLTQTAIAELFGLTRTQVGEVLRVLRQQYSEPETNHG